VTCSGGAFAGTGVATVAVGTLNREVDFVSGRVKGEIDFGGVTGPKVSFTATPSGGAAPLLVAFGATSTPPGAAFAWDFGDNRHRRGRRAEPSVQHARPLQRAARRDGRERYSQLGRNHRRQRAVGRRRGDDAARSAAPDGHAVQGQGGVSRRRASISVVFKGTIKMPAGWTPGLSSVAVDLDGVRHAFALTPGSDKATDPRREQVRDQVQAAEGRRAARGRRGGHRQRHAEVATSRRRFATAVCAT